MPSVSVVSIWLVLHSQLSKGDTSQNKDGRVWTKFSNTGGWCGLTVFVLVGLTSMPFTFFMPITLLTAPSECGQNRQYGKVLKFMTKRWTLPWSDLNMLSSQYPRGEWFANLRRAQFVQCATAVQPRRDQPLLHYGGSNRERLHYWPGISNSGGWSDMRLIAT